MGLLQKLLGKFFDKNRRRAVRIVAPNLVAFVWTGGAPDPVTIRNISMTGLYVETDIGWYPGTLLRMVIQVKEDPDADKSKENEKVTDIAKAASHSISVMGKVIYKDDAGLGIAFFPVGDNSSSKNKNAMKEGVSREELEKFLRPHITR